ncbi:carotenoid oxygenase family protein [Gallaecimonas pentaromativorans]|uniref:carotenoid oxygenase family protein n=1 Tax=Gallaecimonas pentaromativorans TaxID=584787 RepID=UPI003A94CA70
MERRDFLKALGALGGATALSALPLPGLAASLDETWLSGASGDFAPLAMSLQGDWPKQLTGTLYRNGPALFRRAGEQQRHWFDGDGMVQAFRIGPGGISHSGKLVRTEKYQTELQAKRFLYPGVGSQRHGAPIAHNDSANPANISVRRFGNRYMALWEAGSAYEIDPDTLDTKGLVSFAPELTHLPFSAHPQFEPDGSAWNIGSLFYNGLAKAVIYRFDAGGKLSRYQLIDLPRDGYMHAFALSERYLVLFNTALRYQKGDSFLAGLRFDGASDNQIILVDKNSLQIHKVVSVPASFAFHLGTAIEEKGTLELTVAEYPNADIMLKGMDTRHLGQQPYPSAMVRYRLDVASGRCQRQALAVDLEFPQFDWRAPYRRQTQFGVASTQKDRGLGNAIAAISPGNDIQLHRFDDNIAVEEPLLVTARNGRNYLLHTLLDKTRLQTGLALFDPAKVQQGPIATATMPRALPLGFHGAFYPA